MNRTSSERVLRCSFCHKAQHLVDKLIATPGKRDKVYICDQCVLICNAILDEDRSGGPEPPGALLKPHQIKQRLDEYVVGQHSAKKRLSVAVYNHYKRVRMKGRWPSVDSVVPDVEVQKSNILLIGPTGTGKTLIAQTLARILDVPFAITDATTLTEAGYVGEDVENILRRLLQAADGDVQRAQTGIIYIDEIDKVNRRGDNPSITRDVSGEGVQQALLKILEGSVASVPPQGGRKHPHQEFTAVDTTDILFICGGAFVGLDKIVARRIDTRVVGFRNPATAHQTVPPAAAREPSGSEDLGLLGRVQPADLIRYGFIPEFVGRLPVTATLGNLDEDALVEILAKPRNSLLKQYQKLFAYENIEFIMTPRAMRAIAQLAQERNMGARGLRMIMEELMLDLMYEAPSKRRSSRKIVFTERMVREHHWVAKSRLLDKAG